MLAAELLQAQKSAAVPAPAAASDDKEALLAKILGNPLLPSPPTLALQIVEKASDPDCELEHITRLLAQDPALCGKLLKIVNSILYAPPKPVTSINRAVISLGFNRLRSLVLSMSIPAVQFRSEATEGLKIYWKCSVAGAILAREMSEQLRHPSPEDDLVAGLLRDVGMILLQQTFPDVYAPLWNGTRELSVGEQCTWEQQAVGIHHADVSAALLRSWRLPDELVEPVRYHHHPEQLPARAPLIVKRTRLLDFTSRLAQLETVHHSLDDFREILRLANEQFALEPEALEQALASVTPKIEEFARILQLDIGNSLRFAAVLSAGCEELVRLSMEPASPPPAAPPPAPAPAPDVDQAATLVGGKMLNQQKAPPAGQNPEGTVEFFENLGKPGHCSRIQNYEIESIIGRGGMGVVYRAVDVDLGRHVALKMLMPDRAGSVEARKRFIREARTAASIQHENVVSIFAVSEIRGVPFLVMEFVKGRSLQDYLDAKKSFSVPEIAKIGRQMALGLAAAHAVRLIHRDIKPANILLEDGSGRVRITDFGLARAIDDNTKLTQDGLIVGTPQFMSPEQVCGETLDATSDLFSLGSVLYALCTGHSPFEGESFLAVLQAVASRTPKPIHLLNPAVPDWLANVVVKLHAKKPADRYPTAAAVADAMRWSSSLSRLR